MTKRIVITGASGLIGHNLCRVLISRGDEVSIFTRDVNKTKNIITGAKEYIEWNYNQPEEWKDYLKNKDAVIHLAGANLSGKRWTEDYKKKILKSREISTKNLVGAISSLNEKPSLFICASGVNYYGDSGDHALTEDSNAGNDFLAKVCEIWEDEAAKVEKLGVRRISIRTGVVLSINDGALKKMLVPFKLFIGGPLGNGKQWFPWIHIEDIVNLYCYCLDNSSLKGAVNACAPDQVTMNEFAKTLGKVMSRPSLFKVPKFVLKIAVGEVTESITASMKVIPQKLLDEGFGFKFGNLNKAIKNLIGTNVSG